MDLLLVGGGPRSIVQANTDMVFMLKYKNHFEALRNLGAKYDIKLTIVEKASEIAGGDAFSQGHTGLANTPLEDDIVFPASLPSSNTEDKHLMKLLSYKSRYNEKFTPDLESYYNVLKAENLPASVMFNHSVGPMSTSPMGQLESQRAVLLRRTMGQEELETFERICQMARNEIPFFNVQVFRSHLVERILASGGSKTEAVIRQVGTPSVKRIQADTVRLNTGTSLKNPIEDASVSQQTFCRSMNATDVASYLRKRNLLDHNGKLRSGKKILSGGLSLSGLDQINALNGAMDLFEEDDSLLGYRVRQDAIRKYKGALSLVSRTGGKACFPRQSYEMEWKQHTKVIGTTKNMHALFVHDHGQHVFGIWTEVLEGAVARAMNKTPDQVALGKRSSSTSELLSSQFEDSLSHLENRRMAGVAELSGDMEAKKYFIEKSTQTLYGAWRQAAMSWICGFGLEAETHQIIEEMDSFAPITWRERHSMMRYRGLLAGITDPSYSQKVSNLPHLTKFENLLQHVAASPVEIHSMMHLLFESGIATHVAASYEDVCVSDSGEHLQVHGEEYDAFLVSPVFGTSLDVVRKSLRGQVEVYDEKYPLQGKVGKFRRFTDRDGVALQIEDNGLGGRGFKTVNDGVESLTGSFAHDINNRASATDRASSYTMRRMALAHLSAAGLDAHTVLDEIYERQLPTECEYDQEVAKFSVFYEEAMEMGAYLRAIRNVAGDDSERFASLYDAGLDQKGRECAILDLLRSSDSKDIYQAVEYLESMKTREPFKPASRDGYFRRFVDTTDSENAAAYTAALETATQHLRRSCEHSS